MRATKIVALAAAVLVTVIVISVYFNVYQRGADSNKETYAQGLDAMLEADYSSIEKYANKTIYGSEVKYLLNSDASFEISTEKYSRRHPDSEYFSDFSQINNPTSVTYVDQSALFDVSTIQDENGAFLGLRFKEVRM